MNEHERYLFDLQGYITIPNALDPARLDALNDVLDQQIDAAVSPDSGTHRFTELLGWGQPYLDLIDLPTVTPHLEAILGPKFRLDHTYLDIIRSGLGPIGATLHGGGFPFDPVQYFRFSDGRMYNGLSVVAYNLADVDPGDGGFGCIAGSHKSNFRFPAEWTDLTQPHAAVSRVVGPAGTAVLFTEAMTHGSLPWTADHERRTIFYKYSPHPVAWWGEYPSPEGLEGLTDRQREILEGPNARYEQRVDGAVTRRR